MKKRCIEKGYEHGVIDSLNGIHRLCLNEFQVNTLKQLDGLKEFKKGWNNGQAAHRKYNPVG